MDKDYINKKIENCEKLVGNASSETQKEIYQSYLDLWTKKLPVKERPEAIAKREDAKAKKEADTELKAKTKKAELATLEAEEKIQAKIAAIKAEKIAAKRAELAALEAEEAEILKLVVVPKPARLTIEKELELLEGAEYANQFEIENPGKKAYRTQNGDRLKTIAFKEYLNQRTQ